MVKMSVGDINRLKEKTGSNKLSDIVDAYKKEQKKKTKQTSSSRSTSSSSSNNNNNNKKDSSDTKAPKITKKELDRVAEEIGYTPGTTGGRMAASKYLKEQGATKTVKTKTDSGTKYVSRRTGKAITTQEKKERSNIGIDKPNASVEQQAQDLIRQGAKREDLKVVEDRYGREFVVEDIQSGGVIGKYGVAYGKRGDETVRIETDKLTTRELDARQKGYTPITITKKDEQSVDSDTQNFQLTRKINPVQSIKTRAEQQPQYKINMPQDYDTQTTIKKQQSLNDLSPTKKDNVINARLEPAFERDKTNVAIDQIKGFSKGFLSEFGKAYSLQPNTAKTRGQYEAMSIITEEARGREAGFYLGTPIAIASSSLTAWKPVGKGLARGTSAVAGKIKPVGTFLSRYGIQVSTAMKGLVGLKIGSDVVKGSFDLYMGDSIKAISDFGSGVRTYAMMSGIKAGSKEASTQIAKEAKIKYRGAEQRTSIQKTGSIKTQAKTQGTINNIRFTTDTKGQGVTYKLGKPKNLKKINELDITGKAKIANFKTKPFTASTRTIAPTQTPDDASALIRRESIINLAGKKLKIKGLITSSNQLSQSIISPTKTTSAAYEQSYTSFDIKNDVRLQQIEFKGQSPKINLRTTSLGLKSGEGIIQYKKPTKIGSSLKNMVAQPPKTTGTSTQAPKINVETSTETIGDTATKSISTSTTSKVAQSAYSDFITQITPGPINVPISTTKTEPKSQSKPKLNIISNDASIDDTSSLSFSTTDYQNEIQLDRTEPRQLNIKDLSFKERTDEREKQIRRSRHKFDFDEKVRNDQNFDLDENVKNDQKFDLELKRKSKSSTTDQPFPPGNPRGFSFFLINSKRRKRKNKTKGTDLFKRTNVWSDVTKEKLEKKLRLDL